MGQGKKGASHVISYVCDDPVILAQLSAVLIAFRLHA